MIGLILISFVLGDLKWSEVMLREPIARSAPAPSPSPPKPSPEPYPKTACFCDSCKPCKCRDGKHSPGCSEGKPAIEETPRIEPPRKHRAYGGSGQMYEHENEQFLNDWIRMNDPGKVLYYGNCPEGYCEKR